MHLTDRGLFFVNSRCSSKHFVSDWQCDVSHGLLQVIVRSVLHILVDCAQRQYAFSEYLLARGEPPDVGRLHFVPVLSGSSHFSYGTTLAGLILVVPS